MIENLSRVSFITWHICYLVVAGSQGLSPSWFRFFSCHVSFRSLLDDFFPPPQHSCSSFAVLPKTRLKVKIPRTTTGTWGYCVGYQQYLPPMFLEFIQSWSLKEGVIVHGWNISPDAAVIRTVEHPWGPAWLLFKSAGAELIPFKQCCICAVAPWCILLFSLPLTKKEEREK